MRRGEWNWRKCDSCGQRVWYNEIDEDSLSLLFVDGTGEYLRAFTEHDDDREIVEVECVGCRRDSTQDERDAEFMDGFTVEELEDDAWWAARALDES